MRSSRWSRRFGLSAIVAVLVACSTPAATLVGERAPADWPVEAERLRGATSPEPRGSAPSLDATWALDPSFGNPSSDSTEIHVLVWERGCSSESPTTGRMAPPVITYGAEQVTVTIRVRPLAGIQTCPRPPGTPAIVELVEPIGQRKLLDGGQVPPAAPSQVQ